MSHRLLLLLCLLLRMSWVFLASIFQLLVLYIPKYKMDEKVLFTVGSLFLYLRHFQQIYLFRKYLWLNLNGECFLCFYYNNPSYRRAFIWWNNPSWILKYFLQNAHWTLISVRFSYNISVKNWLLKLCSVVLKQYVISLWLKVYFGLV